MQVFVDIENINLTSTAHLFNIEYKCMIFKFLNNIFYFRM